jgi:1,4-alpha-glucan branching enzyme
MTSQAGLLVFSSEFPPHVLGGLGTHVQYMTAVLRQRWNMHVLVPERGGYHSVAGIRIEEIPVTAELESAAFWLRYAAGATRRARLCVSGPAVLQAHDWSTALAAVGARRLLRQPLVFNVHLPQQGGHPLEMENIGLMAADLIIVNSGAVRDEICQRNLPLRRIAVVPNGVDTDLFRPADDWPAHERYILFAGRLVPQKGVDVLLRAFSVLLRRLDYRLMVVGDGLLELYLRRLAKYLGIPNRVSFRDWQTGPALVKIVQNAAVVVVPSHYEPFGIVALESMACARAPVVSRTGGLAEIVEHGVDGYLVEVGDHLDVARRILWLLEDPELSRRMGAAARRKAQRFSWDSAARQAECYYREVRYGGENWLESPEARNTIRLLSQRLNEAERPLLSEIVGGGDL